MFALTIHFEYYRNVEILRHMGKPRVPMCGAGLGRSSMSGALRQFK